MRQFVRLCLLVVGLLSLTACQPPTPHAEARTQYEATHDLSVDERLGGHTLQRHVGKTDQDLRDRLRKERNISAASTYQDRSTAERTIAAALSENADKIQHWIDRGPRRPNFVIDYTDPRDPIGRTINRGAMGSVPCDHAIVVLKADGDSYYVLTSYPECRS